MLKRTAAHFDGNRRSVDNDGIGGLGPCSAGRIQQLLADFFWCAGNVASGLIALDLALDRPSRNTRDQIVQRVDGIITSEFPAYHIGKVGLMCMKHQ